MQREYAATVREMASARVVAGALEQGDCNGGSGGEGAGHEGNVSAGIVHKGPCMRGWHLMPGTPCLGAPPALSCSVLPPWPAHAAAHAACQEHCPALLPAPAGKQVVSCGHNDGGVSGGARGGC